MAPKPAPTPDAHGRYRVRIKGDPQSPSWSTTLFDPAIHMIAGGDASDSYGNAIPERPHWPTPDVTSDAVSESNPTEGAPDER